MKKTDTAPAYVRLPKPIIEHFAKQGRGELSRFVAEAATKAFEKLNKETTNE